MGLKELGEFGLIERLTAESLIEPGRVIVGVGDDCSVTPLGEGRVQLVTTDMLVEGVHFLLDQISPRALGRKAMAVNLSDVAAMGGRPLDAWISVAIPPSATVEALEELYAGLLEEARRHGVNLLGGDTTRSRGDLVLNVVLRGEAEADRLILRSGAEAGDALFVTGELGDSAAGLRALLEGWAEADEAARTLVRRHQAPEPHIEAGRRLAETGLVHAMLDVSDGLVQDLGHLCDRSGVGAQLDEDALPLSQELLACAQRRGFDARSLALSGGEDYCLLLAAAPALEEAGGDLELYRIGRVVEAKEGRTLRTASGAVVTLEGRGWDHFKD